jgi:hypothetical protein
MLKDATALYENCESSRIRIHSVSNSALKELCSKAIALRRIADDLDISEQLLPWTSFIRRLLFAWNTTPLTFEISGITDLQKEYLRLTALWDQRRDTFQEPVKSELSKILRGVDEMSSCESSLHLAYSRLLNEHYDSAFVCQKYWGWGIDNEKLSKLSGVSGIKHPGEIGSPSSKACFFGSPRIYDLKSQSFLWTAPRFKEVHFLTYEHTGISIPGWKNSSINFDTQTKRKCPWSQNVESSRLIAGDDEDVTPLDIGEIGHFATDIDQLVKSLNNQEGVSSDENEISCILLLTECEKILPLRQQSNPDCLSLSPRLRIEHKDAEEIIPGDIILIRSSSGDTLKEVEESQKSDEWNKALLLHKKWKDALSKLIDLGLISEVIQAVDQTPNNIRNWSKPQHHGPENKDTFVALINHLEMDDEAEFMWRTIQALRGYGYSHGTDSSEALKSTFLKLDARDRKELESNGTIMKFLHDDHEAASMAAIIIKEVISYSAKIRPSLINRQLTPDKKLWL